MGDGGERAAQEKETVRVDEPGLVAPGDDGFVDASKRPPGDNVVANRLTDARCREARLDVIALQPIVGVEQADATVFLGNRDKSADPARRVAVVAVAAIEPDVPHASVVDPVL